MPTDFTISSKNDTISLIKFLFLSSINLVTVKSCSDKSNGLRGVPSRFSNLSRDLKGDSPLF